MTTIHAQFIGDQAVLPRSANDQLLEDDPSTRDMMRLAEHGGAFDFWYDEGEDIYTIHDGEAV